MSSFESFSVLVIVICIIWEADSNHLSQVSNRFPNMQPSQNEKTVNNVNPGHSNGHNTRQTRISTNSRPSFSQRTSNILRDRNIVNNNGMTRNTNVNTNNNRNNNINNNFNSGHKIRSMGQMPVTHSLSEMIRQQLITRRLLINLIRQKLLDANGRYTTNINSRGANFMDPRPQPNFPTLDLNQPKSGSLIIEATGGISITEVKTPSGQTEIVIDATSKNNKQNQKSKPTGEPPEVEKPA